MLMLSSCRLLEAAKQASRHGRKTHLPPCRNACSQAVLLPSLQAFRLQTRVRLQGCIAAVLHVFLPGMASGKLNPICETAAAPAGIISQLLQPAMVAAVGADPSAALAAADALRALAALEATAPGSLQAVLCEVSCLLALSSVAALSN